MWPPAQTPTSNDLLSTARYRSATCGPRSMRGRRHRLMAEPRSVLQRRADVRAKLEQNGHAWLATAAGSVPYVIVVQTVWDGESILVTTREASRTARNLEQSRAARLALGDADDAIVIEASLLRA